MTIAIVAAALFCAFSVGAAIGAAHGRKVERRELWEKMKTDRRLGHEVLEQLAQHHRAKLEITET